MIDWELWRILLSVSRHGTYSRAAHALQIDPTTVGRKLKSLERRLGYKLFVRDNDRLLPTGSCEALLPNVEAAAEALRGIESGGEVSDAGQVWREIRITAPPFLVSHMLAPHLPKLVEGLKAVVELIGSSDRKLLSRREADLALKIEDDPTEDMSSTKPVVARRLGEISYTVFAKTGEDAEQLPWAGLTEGLRRTTGGDAQSKLAGSQGIRYRVNQFEELREIVKSGSAKALLPDLVGRQADSIVRLSEPVLRQPLWLLYHRQDETTGYLVRAREWIGDTAAEIRRDTQA